MNKQSGLSRMSASVSKSIVDNVNNVLGLLPKTLHFEVFMPKRTARRRSIRAKAHDRRTKVEVKAERIVAKAKHAVKKAKRSAAKKILGRKTKKLRARNVIALKRKPATHTARAA